jgi:hypothetical protein
MDTFISLTINPSDGTPYQQLVNTSMVVSTFSDDEIANALVIPGAYNEFWKFTYEGADGFDATADDVISYVIGECMKANSVTGPVQVATPPTKFSLTSFDV